MDAVLDRQPLHELEEWDDFVATRYQQVKSEDQFRNYQEDANPRVTEFYRQNHHHQTLQLRTERPSMGACSADAKAFGRWRNT